MWLVGSSCLCKLMTSLFSVVSSHRFVLLAHWSARAPLLSPVLFLSRPPPCLLIDSGPMMSVLAGLKKNKKIIPHVQKRLQPCYQARFKYHQSATKHYLFPSISQTQHLRHLIQKPCNYNSADTLAVSCSGSKKMITQAKVIWVY